MSVEFQDDSGKPRSDEEIKEAIDRVEKEIVKSDFSNIPLFMQFSTIRESLIELLRLREIIKKAMENNERPKHSNSCP